MKVYQSKGDKAIHLDPGSWIDHGLVKGAWYRNSGGGNSQGTRTSLIVMNLKVLCRGYILSRKMQSQSYNTLKQILIVEPYSVVEISYVAEMVGQERQAVANSGTVPICIFLPLIRLTQN